MTVKHTPGPWIDGLDASGIVVVERFSAQTVASLGAISEVSIANAKLIGAVPALADALEAALLFHRGGPWTAEDGQRWRLLTGSSDATTKALCDCIRARLRAAGRLE